MGASICCYCCRDPIMNSGQKLQFQRQFLLLLLQFVVSHSRNVFLSTSCAMYRNWNLLFLNCDICSVNWLLPPIYISSCTSAAIANIADVCNIFAVASFFLITQSHNSSNLKRWSFRYVARSCRSLNPTICGIECMQTSCFFSLKCVAISSKWPKYSTANEMRERDEERRETKLINGSHLLAFTLPQCHFLWGTFFTLLFRRKGK